MMAAIPRAWTEQDALKCDATLFFSDHQTMATRGAQFESPKVVLPLPEGTITITEDNVMEIISTWMSIVDPLVKDGGAEFLIHLSGLETFDTNAGPAIRKVCNTCKIKHFRLDGVGIDAAFLFSVSVIAFVNIKGLTLIDSMPLHPVTAFPLLLRKPSLTELRLDDITLSLCLLQDWKAIVSSHQQKLQKLTLKRFLMVENENKNKAMASMSQILAEYKELKQLELEPKGEEICVNMFSYLVYKVFPNVTGLKILKLTNCVVDENDTKLTEKFFGKKSDLRGSLKELSLIGASLGQRFVCKVTKPPNFCFPQLTKLDVSENPDLRYADIKRLRKHYSQVAPSMGIRLSLDSSIGADADLSGFSSTDEEDDNDGRYDLSQPLF
jgi:hypothetical protein